MRAMALYDWTEEFDMPNHPEFLVELAGDLEIRPTKASFRLKNGKNRIRTVFKKSNLLDVVSPFTAYEGLELCEPIDGNFLNLKSDIQYSDDLDTKTYIVALPPERLPMEKLLKHVRLFCRHMNPRYGFSHVMESPADTFFLAGMAMTSLSYDDRKRADDLGHSLSPNFAREHLSGKLHDVYEFNVLSPAHLQRETFGRTLASWIGAGNRGDLVEINPRVAVWLVPEAIRPLIRAMFFKGGYLIATV